MVLSFINQTNGLDYSTIAYIEDSTLNLLRIQSLAIWIYEKRYHTKHTENSS